MTATSPQQTDAASPPPPSAEPPADQGHLPAKGLARASAIMAAGTLVSRVLGFVRTALLGIAIGGTTLVGDVFEKANTVPNVVYLLLAGGMFNVVLVPQLIKAARRPDRGADYTSRLLTLTVTVLAVFTVLLTLAAYPIIVTLTRGWTEPMLALGTAFAIWTLPQIFFYGLYAVTGQVLNANARFGWYMWAPVLNNVIAIGVIISFIITFGQYAASDDQLTEWTAQQTIWLAAGHTVGIIAQALLLLWPLSRLGMRLRPRFGLKGMGLASTGKIAGWTLVTMLIGNLANLAYMRLISGATAARQELGELGSAVPGEYAANVAELIAILPHSVFVLSIATVLFNQLARAMDLRRYGRAREIMNEGLRIFAIPVMFCMVAVLVLAGPLGRIFAGAAADADLAGAAIGQLLVLLALGMPFRSASFYLMRVFYSAEDAKTPMLIYAIIAVVGLTTAYGLANVVPEQDIAYLVIGLFSALHVLQYLIAHLLVVRRWGGFDFASVLSAYLRSGACAAVAGVGGAGTLWLLGGYSWGFAWESIITAVASCAVVGVVMALFYVLMLRWLRVDEFTAAIAPLARRIPALSRLAR
ncbi:murein biosynthesis integral membrane protein MurJ [Nesterenkonia sp. Act20]|uniref:murein biosynthesis integral membrane protein MurJ n=1 Tax=Nesterenkonia sp. Act20 TaxID=1483432 RepID=UPI0021002A29|nr:lipid II flippase MurJ [Nesterenkonia sp. Act20]